MLLHIIGFICAIFIGLIGAIPSTHINNILPLILTTIRDPIISTIIIISSSIVFCFTSFIPNALFFVPIESNFISLMPSQRFYNNGNSYFAIYLASVGALYGFVFGLPILILFIFVLQYLQYVINFLTPLILISTLFLLIISVKNILGYFTIFFSGTLGIIVLNSNINIINPLFVIIAGLFGLSTIYISFESKTNNVKQNVLLFPVEKIKLFYIGIIGTILSIFVTLFPGLGSGIATYFGVKTIKLDDEGYILLNGAINLLVVVMSFFAAIYLGKGRTGSSVYFLDIAKTTDFFSPFVLFFIVVLSIGIGFTLTLFISKIIIEKTQNINTKKLSYFAVFFLLASVILFSNIAGVIAFLTGTLIGILTIKSNNPRILMLSSIIIPVLINFIF